MFIIFNTELFDGRWGGAIAGSRVWMNMQDVFAIVQTYIAFKQSTFCLIMKNVLFPFYELNELQHHD